MRSSSQFLVRRTRSLLKGPCIHPQRASISSTLPRKYPRKVPLATSSNLPVSGRASSSIAFNHSGPPADDVVPETPPANDTPPPEEPEPEPEPVAEDAETVEKPKRRGRPPKEAVDAVSIPGGLDILWTPDASADVGPVASSSSPTDPALPPPEIMEDIMTNLHVTLHPQTQHRAAFSVDGPTVEPTFALYCPIEGGDYVLDATVREMGRQANADVVVLDAAQLAAGDCGHFGKAASVFKLPQNPLHFQSSVTQPSPRVSEVEEDDDEDDYARPTRQVTLHVMTPAIASSRTGRTLIRSKGGSSSSKIKMFFDELINIEPSNPSTEEPRPRRPRIIYIRDFATLADSSAIWYSALLASVRQRRLGALARSNSPVYNPTTIVFGITPPLVPAPVQSSSRPITLQQILQARGRQPLRSKPNRADYGESEDADSAREKRLLDRLRRWQKGDASLHDDIPRLVSGGMKDQSDGQPEVVILGDGNGGELPNGLSQFVQALTNRFSSKASAPSQPQSEPTNAPFFRTSILVPTERQLEREKESRMARRRELNELTMRMAVAAVGGILPKLDPLTVAMITTEEALSDAASNADSESSAKKFWVDWGERIELWPEVRRIADRAVGSVISERLRDIQNTLEAIPVSWMSVFAAWHAQKRLKQSRKSWIQQTIEQSAEEEEEGGEKTSKETVDEVVQQVKREAEEGDLDQYQQRLMRCIVDPTTLKTTFDQVHLPSHTIDSVRTIVSLPLLHPSAFQSGVLKEHSMAGCLLFGPPGTGKTLVVRALAKEAGSRMLLVQPSDVMDMYYGEAEKLVRAVFALARRLSPCVVFIDEIDALFGARERRGGDYAHRGTITEFMQEMDGLKSSKDDNIIVIGATNRPFDLDDAVLRRLPRRLLVDLPGEKERKEILKILLRDEKLDADIDLDVLARRTENFSGSDLKHLCVAAALDAVKERVAVPWRLTPPSTNTEPSEVVSVASISASDAASVTSMPMLEPVLAPESEPAPTVETLAIEGAAAESLSSATKSSVLEIPPHGSTTPGPLLKPVENVQRTAHEQDDPESTTSSSTTSTHVLPETPPRTLSWRNFEVALKEITPSSSEALASLNDLRKWNEEFGEGRKGRKKHVWGKGKFGFTDRPLEEGDGVKISQPLS